MLGGGTVVAGCQPVGQQLCGEEEGWAPGGPGARRQARGGSVHSPSPVQGMRAHGVSERRNSFRVRLQNFIFGCIYLWSLSLFQ